MVNTQHNFQFVLTYTDLALSLPFMASRWLRDSAVTGAFTRAPSTSIYASFGPEHHTAKVCWRVCNGKYIHFRRTCLSCAVGWNAPTPRPRSLMGGGNPWLFEKFSMTHGGLMPEPKFDSASGDGSTRSITSGSLARALPTTATFQRSGSFPGSLQKAGN